MDYFKPRFKYELLNQVRQVHYELNDDAILLWDNRPSPAGVNLHDYVKNSVIGEEWIAPDETSKLTRIS